MAEGSREDHEVPYPHYQCPSCGSDLPLTDAHIVVTCGQHQPDGEKLEFVIREAERVDKQAIEAICDQAWGETEIDCFGKTYDVLRESVLIAEVDGKLAGIVAVAIDRGDAVIVLLSVYPSFQGQGLGSSLIQAAVDFAAERKLPSVRVAVSNDDIPSLYFYQRRGFAIYDVGVGLIADTYGEASEGFAGIPTRDEVRMRRAAC